jgi:hypothetical protein
VLGFWCAGKLLEVQVRLRQAATQFRPPVVADSGLSQVGHAPSPGKPVDVGGDALEHSREALVVHADDRALRVVRRRAQVGHRPVGVTAELGGPVRAGAQPVDLVDQPVGNLVPPAKFGVLAGVRVLGRRPPGSVRLLVSEGC